MKIFSLYWIEISMFPLQLSKDMLVYKDVVVNGWRGCICCGCINTQKCAGYSCKRRWSCGEVVSLLPSSYCRFAILSWARKWRPETLFTFLALPISRLAECSYMMIHSYFMKLEITHSCLLLCWTLCKQLNCGLQIGSVSFYCFQSNCISPPTVPKRPQLCWHYCN